MMNKVELHLHLDGSIRPETARDIAINKGLFKRDIPLDKVKEMLICTVIGDLKEYLKKFNLPIQLLQDSNSLERVSFELVEDLYSEGTIYAEIRVAPVQHLLGGLKPDEVVESILKGFNRAQNIYPIKVNLLLCAMRHLTESENYFLLDLFNDFNKRGVVGLDLAGNERDFPAKLFKRFFSDAQKIGIPFTIHAGEALGPESVYDAIDIGASRIGHGVRSIEDPRLLDILKKRSIHLELCPVSNRDTKTVKDFKQYPILTYLNSGISVSLNSDNRTVSNTNYDNEIKFLKQYLDIKSEDIIKFNINAINSSFISENDKKFLKELL